MTFSTEHLARLTAARLNAGYCLRGSHSHAIVQEVAEGFAVIIIRR